MKISIEKPVKSPIRKWQKMIIRYALLRILNTTETNNLIIIWNVCDNLALLSYGNEDINEAPTRAYSYLNL
jgi:hypothetical protein